MTPLLRPDALRQNGCSTEHTFVMRTDALGGLWLDDPLLAFGLLSLIWILFAYLHPFARPVTRARRPWAARSAPAWIASAG